MLIFMIYLKGDIIGVKIGEINYWMYMIIYIYYQFIHFLQFLLTFTDVLYQFC